MKFSIGERVRDLVGKGRDNRVPDRVDAGEFDTLLDELHHRAFVEIEADFGDITNPRQVFETDDGETRVSITRLVKILDIEVADITGENVVFVRFETGAESLGYVLEDLQAERFEQSLEHASGLEKQHSTKYGGTSDDK